ncbi:hypothetical protein F2Q70_00007250 [Brassica cretica]|uniref:inorganic diphosphatase n=1 Tax=Brassica cretica TaxID=69181 RepID=A0A8S9MBB4_BRACR|nr:hypothetical protein F2Q70_00007250 [Brassica cretica]
MGCFHRHRKIHLRQTLKLKELLVIMIQEDRRGSIKPLAALAMVDKDWKIVAISLDDPKAHLVNDVVKHFTGTPTTIGDWFRDYKKPDGKSTNSLQHNDHNVTNNILFYSTIQ